MPIVDVIRTMPGQKAVVTLADGRVVIPGAEAKRLSGEAAGLFRVLIILIVIVIVLFMAGIQMHFELAVLFGYILGAIALAITVSIVNLWYQSVLFESGRFKLKKGQPGEAQDEPGEAQDEPGETRDQLKAQAERVEQDTAAFKSQPEAAEA